MARPPAGRFRKHLILLNSQTMKLPCPFPYAHFQTERLETRPLGDEHFEDWKAFLSHPEAMRYFPGFLEQDPDRLAREWIERQNDRYARGHYGLLALHSRETGAFMGQSGLLAQEVDGVMELEVGYHVLPQYWRQGYAIEAAAFFRELAAQHALSPTLISIIHIDNVPSQSVALKNGMQPTKRTLWRDIPVVIYRRDI